MKKNILTKRIDTIRGLWYSINQEIISNIREFEKNNI